MKKRNLGLSILALLWMAAKPGPAQQNPYYLLWDQSFSAPAGAFSLAALQRGVYGLTDKWLKPRWLAEDSFGKKLLGFSYRLSKSVLLDNVPDYLAFLIQHEVFGHGARYREFGYTDNSYSLHLAFPYGDGKGWAFRGIPSLSRKITTPENLLMATGGFDAESLLSQSICLSWVDRGKIHYRETWLYLFTSLNLSAYILRTKYHIRDEEGNDVLSYLGLINPGVGIPESRQNPLTIDDLAGRAWVNALNPFLYFSLYAYFCRYLWMGEETMPLPTVPLGSIKVLPFFRLGLAPFGTEIYFESFASLAERAARFYLRYGVPDFHESWGAGVSVINLTRSPRLSLQARLDLWNQPSLLLGGENVEKTRRGLGGAFLGGFFCKLTDAPLKMGVTAHLGYKTAGYLEGERLGRGFIFRVGLGFLE